MTITPPSTARVCLESPLRHLSILRPRGGGHHAQRAHLAHTSAGRADRLKTVRCWQFGLGKDGAVDWTELSSEPGEPKTQAAMRGLGNT